MLVFPFTWGDVTIDLKFLLSRWSKHSSVLLNRLTKVHLLADTEVFETDPRARSSCQSSGKAARGATTTTVSTPKAFAFRITVPMFFTSVGHSRTAIRFLQRKALIASAR